MSIFDSEDKIDSGYDLLKMIKSSYSEEEFTDKNKFFCDVCKKLSELSIKHTQLILLPEYLIITLNRFYFDQKSTSRRKICDHVQLYENFDFKNILEHQIKSESTAYKMYAIIVHSVIFFFY